MHQRAFCSSDCGCAGGQIAAYCNFMPSCTICKYTQQPGEAISRSFQFAFNLTPAWSNWLLAVVAILVLSYLGAYFLNSLGVGC